MKLIKAILFMMSMVRKLMVANSSNFSVAELNNMDRVIDYTNGLVRRIEEDRYA